MKKWKKYFQSHHIVAFAELSIINRKIFCFLRKMMETKKIEPINKVIKELHPLGGPTLWVLFLRSIKVKQKLRFDVHNNR